MSRLAARLALVAVTFHAIAMGLLHALAPEVDPLSEMVGAYLTGEYRTLSRATFAAMACVMGFVGLALADQVSRGALSKASVALVVVAVVGFLGVATAPDIAHVFAIPTQPAVVLTILLSSLALRREADWRPLGTVLVLLGAALAVLFLLTIVLGVSTAAGLGGLANRLALLLIYAWVVIVARRSLRNPARSP